MGTLTPSRIRWRRLGDSVRLTEGGGRPQCEGNTKNPEARATGGATACERGNQINALRAPEETIVLPQHWGQKLVFSPCRLDSFSLSTLPFPGKLEGCTSQSPGTDFLSLRDRIQMILRPNRETFASIEKGIAICRIQAGSVAGSATDLLREPGHQTLKQSGRCTMSCTLQP